MVSDGLELVGGMDDTVYTILIHKTIVANMSTLLLL